MTIAERLERLSIPEPNSGCFLFTGRWDDWGYGRLTVGSKRDGTYTNRLAHGVAWEMVYGLVPPGLFVLHKCDTPCCVNVDHLFLGTHADNMDDMVRKGRGRKSRGGLPYGVAARGRRFAAHVFQPDPKRGRRLVHLGTFDTIAEAAGTAAAAKVRR